MPTKKKGSEFGAPVGNLKQLKARLKKGAAGPMAYTPKDGITLRFLHEPTEFMHYEECWDDSTRKTFPHQPWMVEGKDYTRKSNIYIAWALDVGKDKIVAFQVKVSVLNRLVNRFEKIGTICDRDFEISKYGTGKETEYEIEPEEKKRRNLDKYDIDKYDQTALQDIIKQAYDAVFGESDDDEEEEDEDEEDQPRRRKPQARRKQRRGHDDDDEDDDEDDEDDEEEDEDDPPRRTSRPAKKVAKRTVKKTVRKTTSGARKRRRT